MNTNPEPGSTPPIDGKTAEAMSVLIQSETVYEQLMDEFNNDSDVVIMTLIHTLGIAVDKDMQGIPQIFVAAKKVLVKKLVANRLDLLDDER